MIRYLTLAEVIELHRAILEQVAGSGGVRDLGSKAQSLYKRIRVKSSLSQVRYNEMLSVKVNLDASSRYNTRWLESCG